MRAPFFSFSSQAYVVTSKPRLGSFPLGPRLSPPKADDSSWKRLSLENLEMFKLPTPTSALTPTPFGFRLSWMEIPH